MRDHAKNGKIDWSAFEGEDIRLIGPGEKLDFEVKTPSVYDGHYVLATLRGDSGIGEVRVTSEYVDADLLWTAVLSSIPAFAITGHVLGGLYHSDDKMRKKSPHKKS